MYEGAEEKLKQLGTGLLEKLGIGGGGGWEQDERERFRAGLVPAENQLPAGQPSVAEPQRRLEPATARAFEPESELDYVELEERRSREPLRQRRYLDEEPEPRRPAEAYEPAADWREEPKPERTVDGRRAGGWRDGRGAEPIDVDPEVLDDPW